VHCRAEAAGWRAQLVTTAEQEQRYGVAQAQQVILLSLPSAGE
jgi:hypothetical protein